MHREKPRPVPKVKLDPVGRITAVLWGEVDTHTNAWTTPEVLVPVARAVDALDAGALVFALFPSAHGHGPERQFVVADYDGVHTPEFAFERSASNVQTAIKRHGVQHPVALDNDYATWKAYENQSWPAHYLIDRSGRIRYRHFGEGAYDRTEAAIRTLLAQPRISGSAS
jgi:hypothetical protein